MSEPDEAMVEAVASAVDLCVDDWNGEPWSMAQEVARAVLSVPVVRDALARDAQVREAWRTCDGGQSDLEVALSLIMPPIPPPGDRDDSEEQQ